MYRITLGNRRETNLLQNAINNLGNVCSPVSRMSCDLCRKCNMMELPKKHTKYLMNNTYDKESWCAF